MRRIVKMQSENLVIIYWSSRLALQPIRAISLCMFIHNYGAGNGGWIEGARQLLQLLSSHPTHKTRKRVKSNYQVSKFILVYAENGTKRSKICRAKRWATWEKLPRKRKETWKTSWKPASMSCEPFDASGLFRQKMICGASALARNAKAGHKQLLTSDGDNKDVEWGNARGYPFQHFRFITIIFTLQTFF